MLLLESDTSRLGLRRAKARHFSLAPTTFVGRLFGGSDRGVPFRVEAPELALRTGLSDPKFAALFESVARRYLAMFVEQGVLQLEADLASSQRDLDRLFDDLVRVARAIAARCPTAGSTLFVGNASR